MIDHSVLDAIKLRDFEAAAPFPHCNLRNLLTEDGHRALIATFPSLSTFTRHEGIPRLHGQRPHDRYYLALDRSHYGTGGVIRRRALAPPWQAFLRELEGPSYRRFLAEMLGSAEFEVRYAWHLGVAGSEVSPHEDSDTKLGTHLFYFNTPEDWQPEWQGSTLLLAGKRSTRMNPDFEDFNTVTETEFLGNRSVLFKNVPGAWHGVRKLRCPEDRHRRLFNVICERPAPRSTWRQRLGGLLSGRRTPAPAEAY